MNTETCAIFSGIIVSGRFCSLDKNPVSLALHQRNLFFIRKNAEDFFLIFRDNTLASLTGVEPAAFRLGAGMGLVAFLCFRCP